MAYEFFFSYARANQDPYLDRFFRDLSREVAVLIGKPRDCQVGFLDKESIELGAEWSPAILDALQTSKVFVAIGSVAYFNSDYCGREWAFFRRRAAAAQGDGPLAPVIKSIVWAPHAIASLPANITDVQLRKGDKDAVHNEKGVRYMLRQSGSERKRYIDLVNALAQDICDAGQRYSLQPLAGVPSLGSLASAFVTTPLPAAAPQPIYIPAPPPSGPKHVHFIFVAADPHDFKDAREALPYEDAGGGDWKPFFPTDRRPINPLLAQVAARDDLLFSSTEVPFGTDLLDRIEEAGRQRQIVVIVIDPWSLHWDAQRLSPRYGPLLQRLDGRLDYHWCVLVPWNENDPGIAPLRAQIAAKVRHTFDRHATLAPNPLFYRENIASAADLQSAVAEVLTRLKEEIKKRADVLRPVPQGPPRPGVTGPSYGA
jgi:FxsC-like protein